ncbi:OLC1v1026843C1 [Oldenlandia corymbosa var. corymbosa]|uniref:Anaphase-promoting complex subunit 1 n=1 Tax=Oldenlandia corymbosa var. corymbosa TaxID=529605 RepID=A0AAV1C7Z6_OLDCO|nr:OLC1v1026843C1 [Oldenlandia corymbosa var. corymbosa]
MQVGVRELTVLGEFKPFGLVAEALDGKPSEDFEDDYLYFLFDPELARQRDEADDLVEAPSSSHRSDHELFIRGNRIIWSIGARVYKRFTLPSKVLKACWCRLGDKSEALLCVLLSDSLTIYNTSGEVVSVPLSHSITSIWPLPFGLLLQGAPERNSSLHIPFPPHGASSSARDIGRLKRGVGCSTLNNFSPRRGYDFLLKADGTFLCSHLILKDPLEEPQPTHMEERGKLNVIREFDEQTIWTSDLVPLMVSHNKGKMQHSVWVAEAVNSNLEDVNSGLFDAVPTDVLMKRISFRRIWQGKGSPTAASKVFLATDDDAVQIICFLLHEQKKLVAVRLHTLEIDNEIIIDIKPDMSWSISAVAAEPVTVTRPRVKIGTCPFVDIIALTSENNLFLYSGKQCLCKYVLPQFLGKDQLLHTAKASDSSILHEVKATELADAVEGRINIVLNSRQIYRCMLRCDPSSSLVNDCLTAMSEALSSSFYNHFLNLLWGDNNYSAPAIADSDADLEWESFCHVIRALCTSSTASQSCSFEDSQSPWDFLVNSRYNKLYSNKSLLAGILPLTSGNQLESDLSGSFVGGKDYESSSVPVLLREIMDSLHAVYECLKLDILRKRDLSLLVVLLRDIADFLREESYLDHYIRDFPIIYKDFRMFQSLQSNKTPPNLFKWLERCLRHGFSSDYVNDLPLLILKDGSSAIAWARKIVSFYSLLCGAEKVGKMLSSGVTCNIASGSYSTQEELVVLAMVGEGFGLQQLDLLPAGVSLPLRHALAKCRDSPPRDWPPTAYVLLGREDLAWPRPGNSSKPMESDRHTSGSLITLSAPYMSHLHPVSIPSSVSDTNELETSKLEDADSVDGAVVDGMEHLFNSSTQLRYGRDLRLNEVRHLLSSARAIPIQTPASPTANDQDLQQAQLWQLAQRTTSLPFGRGAFTLATTHTLLTEALAVPKLVLAGRLPAQQNAVVNLDPNIRNVQEVKSWPEFHNAVAAGLKLAPLQGKMSRTWIMYNKPDEPNVVHAGLLLALGLHGYLHVLSITDIFKYYSQEHESTTVGLMLGLAASYRGTMQPAISKSLYVHIPARQPSSFPEIELPTLLQSAALLSIGLLYEGSAQPQTMQILLGEIGRRSGGDNVLEREGYAVSAGFSLGLVALGRGEDALGFMETMVNRLFQYIGGKDHKNERFHLTQPGDEYQRSAGQLMDGASINVDVTAPGAAVALALMFMKTESKLILSQLSIPQSRFDLQYIRPDFIMLRVIARNLILWSRVYPSEEWIQSQIPGVVQNYLSHLGDEMDEDDEVDAVAFVQAFVNIVVGSCITLGLRFAGTRDGNAQELLYTCAVYFLNEIKPVSLSTGHSFPRGLSKYVDRGTLETCLHLIVLSLCVVMSGSGNLQILRLLKFLRSRNLNEEQANFGCQMAVSLGIGFLFLGGGMRTFSTSNSSIAALLITLYPRLPSGPNDNRCHLQAFRHLYVLATEGRWIQTVDVDSGMPVYAPLEVTISETENYAETSFFEVTPCILPERALLKAVRVCGPRYWPHVIKLIPEEKPWWPSGDKNDPFNSGVLYIKRKVGACSYVDDPKGCQSLLSRAMHKVFGLTCLRTSTSRTERLGAVTLDQLVSTFSSDPSLVAFAQLCSDPSWSNGSDIDFQEFCLQVLFECVSKDRPALLQVYLSLYATIGSMVHEATSANFSFNDSLSLWSLKVAVAYSEALLAGRFTLPSEGILQSTFLVMMRKRVEEILTFSADLNHDTHEYLLLGTWPKRDSRGLKRSMYLSWYLQWYSVPSATEVKRALEKLKHLNAPSSMPLLHMLFPRTHVTAISDINRYYVASLPR